MLTATNHYTVAAADLPLLVNTFLAWAIAPNGSMGSGSVSAAGEPAGKRLRWR